MVFDFFKKKKKEEEFRIEDLVLSKLKTGFMIDYDMKTYIVAAYNKYQWDEGGVTGRLQAQAKMGALLSVFAAAVALPAGRLGQFDPEQRALSAAALRWAGRTNFGRSWELG